MSTPIRQAIADSAVQFTNEHAQGFGDMVDQTKIFIPAAQMGVRLALNSPEVRAMREVLYVYQTLAEKDLLTYERQREYGKAALAAFDQLLKELGE